MESSKKYSAQTKSILFELADSSSIPTFKKLHILSALLRETAENVVNGSQVVESIVCSIEIYIALSLSLQLLQISIYLFTFANLNN